MANDAPKNSLLYRIPIADKDKFLKFVKEGERNPDGSPKKDAQGNNITGVIDWLKNEPGEHTIYTATTADFFVFITTTNSDGDWSKIPRFQEQFGPNIPSTLDEELNNLLNT